MIDTKLMQEQLSNTCGFNISVCIGVFCDNSSGWCNKLKIEFHQNSSKTHAMNSEFC